MTEKKAKAYFVQNHYADDPNCCGVKADNGLEARQLACSICSWEEYEIFQPGNISCRRMPEMDDAPMSGGQIDMIYMLKHGKYSWVENGCGHRLEYNDETDTINFYWRDSEDNEFEMAAPWAEFDESKDGNYCCNPKMEWKVIYEEEDLGGALSQQVFDIYPSDFMP